jgi:hypothetical protein
MKGVAVLDSNLTVLLVVGSASTAYIEKHKRLKGYHTYDFEVLGLIIAEFLEIVLLPYVLTEASNLVRQIEEPAKGRISTAFRTFITTAVELPIPSAHGAMRSEYERLGLTDAVLLHLCSMSIEGIDPTLITADSELADVAGSLGHSVIDYRRDFQTE